MNRQPVISRIIKLLLVVKFLQLQVVKDLVFVHKFVLQYVEAVELYREVLRSVESYKDEFRTDELQYLHTLHNLHEVLTLQPPGVDPTLRDHQLRHQVGGASRGSFICRSLRENNKQHQA